MVNTADSLLKAPNNVWMNETTSHNKTLTRIQRRAGSINSKTSVGEEVGSLVYVCVCGGGGGGGGAVAKPSFYEHWSLTLNSYI